MLKLKICTFCCLLMLINQSRAEENSNEAVKAVIETVSKKSVSLSVPETPCPDQDNESEQSTKKVELPVVKKKKKKEVYAFFEHEIFVTGENGQRNLQSLNTSSINPHLLIRFTKPVGILALGCLFTSSAVLPNANVASSNSSFISYPPDLNSVTLHIF